MVQALPVFLRISLQVNHAVISTPAPVAQRAAAALSLLAAEARPIRVMTPKAAPRIAVMG